MSEDVENIVVGLIVFLIGVLVVGTFIGMTLSVATYVFRWLT